MRRREILALTYIGLTGLLSVPIIFSNNAKIDKEPKREYALESIVQQAPKIEEKTVPAVPLEEAILEIQTIKGTIPSQIERIDTLTIPKSIIDVELQKYNNQVSYALKKSKKEKVILINKLECTLELLENEKVIKRYDIGLGPNYLEDKQMEGDGKTPEGIYSIDFKLGEGNSTFYKAMHINYPTKKDKDEFKINKKSGLIPKDAKIGRDIEIHGHGSGKKGNCEGFNWTEGCIALSDSDIDTIYNMTRTGTPVVIVRYSNVKY